MTKYTTIFADESGVSDSPLNPQPFYGIGFLKVEHMDELNQALMQLNLNLTSTAKLRRRAMVRELGETGRSINSNELNLLLASSRHYEFHFAEISRDKVAQYLYFLETLFQFDFHFCAYVIDRRDHRFDITAHGNYWESLIQGTRFLCERSLDSDELVTIISDFTHKPKDSELFFRQELVQMPRVCNAMMLQSVGVPLLQACDILLGCLMHSYKRHVSASQEFSSRNFIARSEVLAYLERLLGLTEGEELHLAFQNNRNPRFAIWQHDFS